MGSDHHKYGKNVRREKTAKLRVSNAAMMIKNAAMAARNLTCTGMMSINRKVCLGNRVAKAKKAPR